MTGAVLVGLSEAVHEIPTGRGPDGVAAFLMAQGCHAAGPRGPLVAYLARRTGFAPGNFTATTKSVHFTFWEDVNRYPQEIVFLPPVIGKFLLNCDLGGYPRLTPGR